MKQRKMWWLTGGVVLVAIVVGGMLLSKSSALHNYMMEKKVNNVLADYAENVVHATLTTFISDVAALEGKIATLKENRSDEAVAEAAQAWRNARNQWQKARSFFYGPGVYYDFNRKISTFPIDRPLIDDVVSKIEADDFELSFTNIRRFTRGTQRGLLTIEYLLFEDEKARSAAKLSDAEQTYLAMVSRVLRAQTLDFTAAWFGTASLSVVDQQLVQEAGSPKRAAFADEFIHPGTQQSRYFSSSVVLQDIFGELDASIGDVCAVITEDIGSDDFYAGETWFSNNRLDDLLYALKGAENAFFGGETGKRKTAVADLVEAHDELLKKQIEIAFVQAQSQLKQAGSVAGKGQELALRKAEVACNALLDKVNSAVLPVVLDPVTRPYAAYGR